MIRYGWVVKFCVVLILVPAGICQESSERDGKFLALDKLKSRYIETSFSTFPFLRPLWHSKSDAPQKNTTKVSRPTEMPPEDTSSLSDETGIPVVQETIPVLYDYSCPPCWCGIANRMDRIVGGWATEVNEYPWMAALLQNGKFFCGGSLISDRYVLTAAHCVRSSKRHKNLTVVFSEHIRGTIHETQIETRRVVQVLTYPKYNAQGQLSHDHDIALLKLNTPLEFKPTVSPVCLPQLGNNNMIELGEKYTRRTGTVVGWGRISEQGDLASELMATQVPVMSNQECKQFPGFEAKLTANMMCAGYAEGGKDSCQGDSGGALLTEDIDGRHLIAGIVSWGIGCARPQSPGVYTRVNHYMDWIQANTRDACFCY